MRTPSREPLSLKPIQDATVISRPDKQQVNFQKPAGPASNKAGPVFSKSSF
jgi:hypothetical protein